MGDFPLCSVTGLPDSPGATGGRERGVIELSGHEHASGAWLPAALWPCGMFLHPPGKKKAIVARLFLLAFLARNTRL